MNNRITFVERRIAASKTRLVPVSSEREKLTKHMTGAMEDAEWEISEAFTIQTSGMGYASQDLNRVDGRREATEDYSSQTIESLINLEELKRLIKNAEYGILLDICVFQFPLADVCYQRNMPEQSVINSYTNALNEWCVLRGWGEQKKTV